MIIGRDHVSVRHGEALAAPKPQKAITAAPPSATPAETMGAGSMGSFERRRARIRWKAEKDAAEESCLYQAVRSAGPLPPAGPQTFLEGGEIMIKGDNERRGDHGPGGKRQRPDSHWSDSDPEVFRQHSKWSESHSEAVYRMDEDDHREGSCLCAARGGASCAETTKGHKGRAAIGDAGGDDGSGDHGEKGAGVG